ncbi:MAG: hypothetical protein E7077_02570 [Bacteroidales bacterium]|jgi:hypothetical protein|nr:hypothetical protein [Bacteroidales bacterium]
MPTKSYFDGSNLVELIVPKKSLRITEVFLLLFLFAISFWTIRFVPLFILNTIFFVWELRDVYLRCKDRDSFIKITFDGVTCVNALSSISFSYEWKEVKKLVIKKVINGPSSNVTFTVETDSGYSIFCIDHFDISSKDLLDSLKRFVPDDLAGKICYIKSY